MDKQLKRVKFTQTQTNEISFKVNANFGEQCRDFETQVRYSEKDIFTPIDLEMHYELTKKVPHSEGKFDLFRLLDLLSLQRINYSQNFAKHVRSSIQRNRRFPHRT